MAHKIREEDWLVESGRRVDELDELDAVAFGLVGMFGFTNRGVCVLVKSEFPNSRGLNENGHEHKKLSLAKRVRG